MKSTLRNAINARIPELLELKMGCRIKQKDAFSDWNDWAEYATILWKEVFKKEDFISTQYAIRFDWYSRVSVMPVDALNFEILWTPPSWSDYLRCLGEDYAIRWNGLLMQHGGDWYWFEPYFVSQENREWVKLDLTKWPLEQSDEILQKLVDLIPPL